MDWNEIIKAGDYATSVEAYTASWIEISNIYFMAGPPSVEAYTALWIEITISFSDNSQNTASWIEIVEKADVESPNTSRLI